MDKVISMYEAKTHLSKLVKQAQAGHIIYIGAYGQAQAVIAPLPTKKPINIGVWAHKYKPGDFDDEDLIAADAEIAAEFNASAERPFPE